MIIEIYIWPGIKTIIDSDMFHKKNVLIFFLSNLPRFLSITIYWALKTLEAAFIWPVSYYVELPFTFSVLLSRYVVQTHKSLFPLYPMRKTKHFENFRIPGLLILLILIYQNNFLCIYFILLYIINVCLNRRVLFLVGFFYWILKFIWSNSCEVTVKAYMSLFKARSIAKRFIVVRHIK